MKEINHSTDVLEDLSRLFLNEKLSDVVFIVDNKHIAGHKAVLSARSPIFKDMFFNQTVLTNCKREIHIKDCSALSFKSFIKYIYTGKLSLIGVDDKDIEELLSLALKYEIKRLTEALLEPNAKTSTIIEKQLQKLDLDELQNIKKQNNTQKSVQTKDLSSHSGFENIGLGTAVAIEGINPEKLFVDKNNCDEKSLTKHKIEVNSKGIIIRFHIPVLINIIRFRLLDTDPKRHYSYFVQLSATSNQWDIVADYRQYSCRSWQTICFDQRLVKFVRIMGTKSSEKLFFSNTLYFTIVSFMCGLIQTPIKLMNGLWEPQENMASKRKGAVVIINGNFCKDAKMINDYEFEFKKYNNICSEFHFNTESQLIIHLAQPIITSSISFYIHSNQKFKYTVRVTASSIDKEFKVWTVVANKLTQFNAPKWQIITFAKTRVLLISISSIRCLDENVNILPILAFSCP
ncbi:BTB/POZ domain-containing protein 9-like [Oppia nitens]|uniref:BTB/POZ domain-containing protein 9-like n=1 Tax=Oppia nitens TaxID=1686743 RepID=UPI0023DC6DCE|nr:BTB/POZ domain-containing protein 9-like [Oppia nitens]